MVQAGLEAIQVECQSEQFPVLKYLDKSFFAFQSPLFGYSTDSE
jgi:hypothetical protein